MGLKNVNQNLTVWVSRETGPQAAANMAALPLTGISYETEAGVLAATVPANGAPYSIVYKGLDGQVHRTSLISPLKDTVTLVEAAYAAETMKVSKVTIPATVLQEDYQIAVEVFNFGGFKGARNTNFYYGAYTPAAGDSATNVAAGLVLSLNATQERLNTPLFVASNVAGLVSITATAQTYTEQIYSGLGLDYVARLSYPRSIVAMEDVASVGPNPGQGTYKLVANAESAYAAYNLDYVSDGGNYPIIGSPVFAAEAGATYLTNTFIVEHVLRVSPVEMGRKVIELYYKQ